MPSPRKFCLTLIFLGILTISGNAATRAQSVTVTLLHSFTYNPDGAGPDASLVQGSDGNLYGTTIGGGFYSQGTVFKITPDGSETLLHTFSEGSADGALPSASLTLGSDGNFYSTTFGGGAGYSGTVFRITSAGTLTILYSFSTTTPDGTNADGASPSAGLALGNDGNFYGATDVGGPYKTGTIFRITPAGGLTTLHSFSAAPAGSNSDGADPRGTLVQGQDGNFYGTTEFGGLYGNGTVFRITPSGQLASLYSFSVANSSGANADGVNPIAGLIQGRDGDFYGTTNYGGAYGVGTVFKITPSGMLTTLHAFNNTDGAYPAGSLVQASDGNLYGTTQQGGLNNQGTIFKLNPDGACRTLYSFSALAGDGFYPVAGLIQGRDGDFYGTTSFGGTAGGGTVFRLKVLPYIPSDFNGDGTSDLVFQNSATGQLAVWFLQGNAATGAYLYPAQNQSLDPIWQCVGLGDLNGDGHPDPLFQNRTTGQLAVWYMSAIDGLDAASAAFVYPRQDPAWRCVSVNQLGSDSAPTLLFQNQTTGRLAMWFMDPAAANYALKGAYVYPQQSPVWRCVGMADFNEDGQPDILFQNRTTGQLVVWFMDALFSNYAASGTYLTSIQDPAWQAEAIGDLNGDGQPDIVFQNQTTGQLAVWYMSGTSVKSTVYLSPIQDPHWRLVGPH